VQSGRSAAQGWNQSKYQGGREREQSGKRQHARVDANVHRPRDAGRIDPEQHTNPDVRQRHTEHATGEREQPAFNERQSRGPGSESSPHLATLDGGRLLPGYRLTRDIFSRPPM
jgi:hypothetical protein